MFVIILSRLISNHGSYVAKKQRGMSRDDLVFPPSPEQYVSDDGVDGDGGETEYDRRRLASARASYERGREIYESLPYWSMEPPGIDLEFRPAPSAQKFDDAPPAILSSEALREELVRVLEAYKVRVSGGGEVRRLDEKPYERFMEYWRRYTDSSQSKSLREGEFKQMTRLGFVAFISLMADDKYCDAWRLATDCLPLVPNSDGTRRRMCDAMKGRQEDALLALWSEESAKRAFVSHRELLDKLRKLPTVRWITAVDEGRWEHAIGIAIKNRMSQRRQRLSVEGFHHQLVSDGRGDEARGLEHQYSQFFDGNRRRK